MGHLVVLTVVVFTFEDVGETGCRNPAHFRGAVWALRLRYR